MIEIVHDDVLNWAKNYTGKPFHCLFCDAPYLMDFMGLEFDKADGIAGQAETWELLAKHLLPGAFLFVFAGTLNDDVISMAMRKAGLRRYHKIIYWGQSSGFPKATNISKNIDKQVGAKREIVGKNKRRNYQSGGKTMNGGWQDAPDITESATDLARIWEGHRYGGQALSPSCESILIFQKPIKGKALDNIVEYGTGTFWVDGARIKTSDKLGGGGYTTPVSEGWDRPFRHDPQEIERLKGVLEERVAHAESLGRWPKNLILGHAPECELIGSREIKNTTVQTCANRDESGKCLGHNNAGRSTSGETFHTDQIEQAETETIEQWACVDNCPVRLIGEQSGVGKSVRSMRGSQSDMRGNNYGRSQGVLLPDSDSERGYSDSGTASRFYFNTNWTAEIEEQIELSNGVYYCAKASKSERDAGLDDVEPVWTRYMSEKSTEQRRDGLTPSRNSHPCVKNLSLCKYISSLILPPIEYAPRRLLVPFAGTMSEAIGAMQAGWEEIVAIEMNDEYVEIGRKRISYWEAKQKETLF